MSTRESRDLDAALERIHTDDSELLRNIEPHDNELFSNRETADMIHVRPDTLANMRSAGKGPEYIQHTPGGTVLYRYGDIQKWLDRFVVVPTDTRPPR